MDVSHVLDAYKEQNSTNVLARTNPVATDPALLAAFDFSPVDPASYTDLEPHLLELTLTSTQSLVSSLFTLPTHPSALGSITKFPLPTTLLPREKPLPKPKPETKWERFAKAKGISHKNREKDVFDEERQEWVGRWGRNGKNREKEEQWLHEVKAGADADQDPAKTARDERKARVNKNLKQQQANIAAAAKKSAPIVNLSAPTPGTDANSAPLLSQAQKKSAREVRKSELIRSMLISKTSTASMGKFDDKIEGEPKARGMKRKFEPTVGKSFEGEKTSAMDVLKRVERGEGKKARKGGEGVEGGLNARKAMRFSGEGGKMKPKTTGKKGKRK
ncbi:hypothetical protein L198_08118 [Cryptococcus wingfieldii CBS 7118]|uniref:Ribosome biogenesis regulatory protein n=1 Tax=Cryptococcus wingfieldii CBS 7118 TaxID=1295528 RepID=A0A1E3HJ13_9TREE|nr:hypothetical protein L198_08118 [Cryptococcus wingfieldii CBS 7118]ODN76342.1 hypothetical protein L198_08118 [Cryptococcus wingfieldii CBS 7118]